MNNLNDRLKEITSVKNANMYPPFPNKNLLIEVTNNCNCNCIFCANSKMKRKRKFINPNLAVRILREAHDLGVEEVGFYTTGESLLDKNLTTYISTAKQIGYKYIYITTNAILLEKDKAKELILSGIDSIKLSINAINSEDYNFIHGVNYYEKVMSNLINLYQLKIKNEFNFKIFVSYIATVFTDYDVNIIKENFINYCDEVVVINVRNQTGMMPEINKLLSCVRTDNKIQADRIIPCHYVFDTINVSCEGYLTACCTDFENYLAYADLNKVSLKEGWHNELITTLRKKHLDNKLDNILCHNCIYCSDIIPKPLANEFVEKEITYQIFSSNKVAERIKKYKKI